MDVQQVIFPIASDAQVEIEEDTPLIMHPEPLFQLVPGQPNQALVSNNKQIFDLLNDWGND
jgi:hypothetical protein